MSFANPPRTLPAALESALSTFPAGAALLAGALEVRAIKSGRTNQTWRVTGAGGDWAVRVSAGHDARLLIDRRLEADLLARVAAAEFCPPPVFVLTERGILITQFDPAPQPSEELARSAPFVRQLGQRLRELHALKVPEDARVLDLGEVLVHYAELEPTGVEPIPRARVIDVLRRRILRYEPTGTALCHHDLHSGNILCSQPLRFIDWEYAAWSDPLLDLAAYVGYQDLDDAAQSALLDGYGAAPRRRSARPKASRGVARLPARAVARRGPSLG